MNLWNFKFTVCSSRCPQNLHFILEQTVGDPKVSICIQQQQIGPPSSSSSPQGQLLVDFGPVWMVKAKVGDRERERPLSKDISAHCGRNSSLDWISHTHNEGENKRSELFQTLFSCQSWWNVGVQVHALHAVSCVAVADSVAEIWSQVCGEGIHPCLPPQKHPGFWRGRRKKGGNVVENVKSKTLSKNEEGKSESFVIQRRRKKASFLTETWEE